MAGFNEDLKGYVSNKQFKDPAALADAYRNLEKLQGVPQDRLMKLPESMYDEKGALTAEGRGIYERLGAPKDAKDYGLEAPKDGGDPARLAAFLKNAHEMGLTKAQAQKLAASDSDYIQGLKTSGKEAAVANHKNQVDALTKEWGAAMESNTQIAREGKIRLGLDDAKVDALSSVLGHAETMKLLCNLGKSVSEGTFVKGGRPNAPLEPAGAHARIQELMQDKDFGTRLMNGEAEAKATWQRLHEQRANGQMVGV
jgi:hypothetical protein